MGVIVEEGEYNTRELVPNCSFLHNAVMEEILQFPYKEY